jgi:two-component system chemotaxis response regulator CheB
MIRVLIADDSALMRKIVSDALNTAPDIEVIDTAHNGVDALKKASKLQPDIVLMDINMPKMDGVQATHYLLENVKPSPVIIIFSGYTEGNADLVLECLDAGAFSCINKPAGTSSMTIGPIQKELIGEIRSAAKASKSALSHTKEVHKKRLSKPKTSKSATPLVIIGASTGGPPVIQEILEALPEDFPAAVMVIQHMPKGFTKSFARRIDLLCHLKVKEAEEGEPLKAGTALVAPGDLHTEIINTDGVLRTHITEDPPVHNLRPAIDVTMLTAAKVVGNRTIVGVILTGMGQDGAHGMQVLKSIGAHTIAQDPETCVVDSMPQNAIGSDAISTIAAPENIAKLIMSFVNK